MSSSKPVLTYFDLRGRAEPIRLLLADLGIDYEDRRISDPAEWQRMKPSMPFGTIPSYQQGARMLVQSYAICRHLARVHDLYGRDESDRTAIDITHEAIRDIREPMSGFFWRENFEQKRASYASAELEPALARLEQWIRTNSSDPGFVVGNAATFVDALGFALLDDVRAQFPDSLTKFGRLAEFHAKYAARQGIARYLNSGRRPKALQMARDVGLVVDPAA